MIYGEYEKALKWVLDYLQNYLNDCCYGGEQAMAEHMLGRIKSEESMEEKCVRKGLPVNAHSALCLIRDGVGFRIVCHFVDEIYQIAGRIKNAKDICVVEEKDYIKNAKPNGYRSYHMILKVLAPFQDPEGNKPGSFYAEIQLRTIAMDSWAALEHEMKYKKDIRNQNLIVSELKRCADELAACDASMQTIRDLIRG